MSEHGKDPASSSNLTEDAWGQLDKARSGFIAGQPGKAYGIWRNDDFTEWELTEMMFSNGIFVILPKQDVDGGRMVVCEVFTAESWDLAKAYYNGYLSGHDRKEK